MRDDVVTTAFVRAGKLKVRHAERFTHLLDGEYELRLRRLRATRSRAQAAYYFGVVLEQLSDRTGYTVDELHDWAKQTFLPKALAFADRNGEVVDERVIGGTTTTLNKLEFSDYVEAIRRFAAERLDVVIGDPDPEYWTHDVGQTGRRVS